jgi:hypothetical protein
MSPFQNVTFIHMPEFVVLLNCESKLDKVGYLIMHFVPCLCLVANLSRPDQSEENMSDVFTHGLITFTHRRHQIIMSSSKKIYL